MLKTILRKLGSGILSGAIFCSLASAQDALGGWRADGPARAVELTAADEDANGVVFTFQNVSGRAITALHVSRVGVDSGVDFSEADDLSSLGPGQTYKLRSARVSTQGGEARVVTVKAVIFEDGTAVGAAPFINLIAGRRLGRVLEAERVRRIFALPVSGHIGTTGVRALGVELGELPGSAQEARTVEASFGCDR